MRFPSTRRAGARGALLLCLAGPLAACTTTPAPDSWDARRERELQAAAARGDSGGAVALAQFLADRDDWRALRWYRAAAEAEPMDHAAVASAARLGRALRTGSLEGYGRRDGHLDLRRPDPREARPWLLRAAAHGSTAAMLDLWQQARRDGDALQKARWRMRFAMTTQDLRERGALRLTQLGGLPDMKSAPTAASQARLDGLVATIRAQAAQGDAEAQVDLGVLQRFGIGMPADPSGALASFRRAGEAGNVFGLYFAGLLAMEDVVHDVERVQVADWFARAHAAGFLQAGDGQWQELRAPFFNFSS